VSTGPPASRPLGLASRLRGLIAIAGITVGVGRAAHSVEKARRLAYDVR